MFGHDVAYLIRQTIFDYLLLISSLSLADDGTVTKQEFVSFWQLLTHQSKEHSEAYFYLADLNDDGIINSKDLAPLHHVFDLDGKLRVYSSFIKYEIRYQSSCSPEIAKSAKS